MQRLGGLDNTCFSMHTIDRWLYLLLDFNDTITVSYLPILVPSAVSRFLDITRYMACKSKRAR